MIVKSVFFVVLIAVSCMQIRAQSETRIKNYDFKRVQWGMTRDQVIASEDAQVDVDLSAKDKSMLFYNERVFGYEVLLSYKFVDNMLVRAMYGIIMSNDYNNCLNAYSEIKPKLIQKYGRSVYDMAIEVLDSVETHSTNPIEIDNARDTRKNLYTSVSTKLKYAGWMTDQTTVELEIRKDNNFGFVLGLLYTSNMHKNLIKEWIKSEY